jgi:hypothetical protein
MDRGKFTWRLALGSCGLLLFTLHSMSGQTAPAKTTTPPPAQKPKRVAPQPKAKAAAALPARQMASAPSAASTFGGLPSRQAGTAATSNSVAQPAPSNPGTAGRGSPRTALTTQGGVGTFHGADYTLTAYGCYRSGEDLLCDFDITKLRAAQVGLQPFGDLAVVDNGGKINRRSDAYYMAADGSRMENAYVSTNAVRYVMQFNGIAQQTKSVSLVRGAVHLDNVPINTAAASASSSTPAQ